MEAQQIKLNINQLVEGIHDESFLTACYEAVEGIAKAYRRVSGKQANIIVKKEITETEQTVEQLTDETQLAKEEQVLPHDLSLVVLANKLFKGSEPLPEEGERAFERAFKKSLKKQPTLSNRL